jgi:hypothetical protein
MIERDLSDLPSASRPQGTNYPLPAGQRPFLDQLMEQFVTDYEAAREPKPLAIPEAGWYRASFSTECERELYYHKIEAEETDPPTAETYWNWMMGTFTHDTFQAVMKARWPETEIEAAVDLRPLGVPGSASADAVMYVDGEIRANVEIKSTGGYSFKNMTGSQGNKPGPRGSAVVQGALANRALGAPKLIVPYIAFEPDRRVKDKTPTSMIAAQWEYTAEECDMIIDEPIGVITKIDWFHSEGALPTRELHIDGIVRGAVVQDPSRGMWVKVDGNGNAAGTGTTWKCDYCNFRKRCQADGPGGIDTSEAF